MVGGNALRPHASGRLDKSLVLSDHKVNKIMVEMEMLSSLYSNLSDTEEEGEVVKYVMDPIQDGNDLRYTLTAVGNNRGEVALERLIDVRRSAKASCYFSLCTFNCQAENYGDFYGGEEPLSKFQADALCSHSSQWLERSWLAQKQYEEDIWSRVAHSISISVVTTPPPGLPVIQLRKCTKTSLSVY